MGIDQPQKHYFGIRAEGYDYGVYPDSGQLYAVARATGEVTDAVTSIVPAGTIFLTPEDQEIADRRKAQYQEFAALKELMDSFGPFSFVRSTQDFADVSPETAARLIYLSTFSKWGQKALFLTRRCQMTRDNLPMVMGLSRQTAGRFLDEVVPEYVSLDDANNLYLNPERFRRGTIGRHDESNSWRKIYVDSVKRLYRLAGKTRHRYLGYVFQMLPFISIEYNVLCADIFEKDLNMLQFMTDKDFCDRIGYNYTAVSRLKKIYRNICFDVEGHTEPFCAFVEVREATRIYVNPRILYNGTQPKMVEILGSFCKDA